MTDNKRRNPFEDHIESEAFDLSLLGKAVTADPLLQLVSQFLDQLPQPIDYRLWDSHLTDEQKRICAYLATELVQRVLRKQFAKELEHLSDDELIFMITALIAVGMIGQTDIIPPASVTPPSSVDESPPFYDLFEEDSDHYMDDMFSHDGTPFGFSSGYFSQSPFSRPSSQSTFDKGAAHYEFKSVFGPSRRFGAPPPPPPSLGQKLINATRDFFNLIKRVFRRSR